MTKYRVWGKTYCWVEVEADDQETAMKEAIKSWEWEYVDDRGPAELTDLTGIAEIDDNDNQVEGTYRELENPEKA